jgi:hypothetical protein
MDVHQTIMKDLRKRKICVKLVLKNLSDEQKDNCVLVFLGTLGSCNK